MAHCLANFVWAGNERLFAAIVQKIQHRLNFRPHAAWRKMSFIQVLAELNGRNLTQIFLLRRIKTDGYLRHTC